MTLFSMAIPAFRKQLFEAVGASLVSVLSSKKVSTHPLVVLIQSKTGHPLHVNISAVPQTRHDVDAFLYAPRNILCCAILPEFDESLMHTIKDVTTLHDQLATAHLGPGPIYSSGGSAPNNSSGFTAEYVSTCSGVSRSNSVGSFDALVYDDDVNGNHGGMDYGQTDSSTQAILSTVSRWM